MKTGIDFQIVCGKCGSLAVKIENPERASRETIVYCSDCGASRGTIGGLRDGCTDAGPRACEPAAVHQAVLELGGQELRRRFRSLTTRGG